MLPVVPNAQSPLLYATHIILIRVGGAASGAWSTRPAGGIQRSTTIDLTLEEVLKGKLDEPAGGRIRIEVMQYDTGTSRVVAMPGAWSDKPLDPGVGYVAFCRGQERAAGVLLRDPHCDQLLPPETALFDVRLANQAAAGLPLRDVLERANQSATQLNYLFPEYLAEAHGRAIVADIAPFHATMQLLLAPDLTGPARSVLLRAIYAAYNSAPIRASGTSPAFILALFRLLALGRAAELHENIVTAYLPALIGIDRARPTETADHVFLNDEAMRGEVREKLRTAHGAERLIRWLDTRGAQ
jgi:hypothetical protein